MNTIAIIWILLLLAASSAMALEACNRYVDNVDECYKNYYRDATNYNYERHRNCRVIDGYQQCSGGNEPRVTARNVRRSFVRDNCWYDRYAGKMVCEDRYRD